MKIALLSAAKSIHTVRWANALSERGHTVALFTLTAHKARAGAYGENIEVHELGRGGAFDYWFAAGELKKQLAAFRPDILNAHYATGYGTLARRCGFRPLLLSVWGSDVYDFPNGSPVHRALLRKNLEAATAIGSTSRAMARQVRRVWPCERDIYITPFGVDTELFRPGEKPPEGCFTVGIVKALEPKYGVDYLLRAFALFKARLRGETARFPGGLRLEIYGGGSQLDALKELAKSLGIDAETAFHGPVPHTEVPAVLRGFDVFCAPSVYDSESFGVAAVEAMACGVPVVVSDADGLREVTLDGTTGYVIHKRDAATLANKLTLLAHDPSLRASMGRAGRAHVLKNYRWEDNVETMENALTDTLAKFRAQNRGA